MMDYLGLYTPNEVETVWVDIIDTGLGDDLVIQAVYMLEGNKLHTLEIGEYEDVTEAVEVLNKAEEKILELYGEKADIPLYDEFLDDDFEELEEEEEPFSDYMVNDLLMKI